MAGLVDDLVDVARISRGKIRLQHTRLELNELLRQTAKNHRSLFARSGIDLDVSIVDQPLHLNGDSARLAQAIGNLLHNSTKFTPRGGRTTLSLQRGDGDLAVIRVRDNGIGIPAETLSRLFEPFVAGTAIERSEGGLGLGLALAKGLVNMHGGSISATSDGVGKGAEFVVRLPLVKIVPIEVSGTPTANGTGHRVLIIEDSIDSADSLGELLEDDGHQIVVAYNGAEGIAKAHAFQPEFVLCDLGLPDITGYEVARTLLADDALNRACLVALSGYALPQDIQHATEAGFAHYLAKPFDLEKLRALLSFKGERVSVSRIVAQASEAPGPEPVL